MPTLTQPSLAAGRRRRRGSPCPARVLEVVDPHRLGPALRPPLPAAVLEVPDQLLLLGVHRDDRLPAAIAACTAVSMYPNWASRSGWLVPSRVLRLAWSCSPPRQQPAHRASGWRGKPRPRSARAIWRWLRLTQRSGVSGSPRIASSTSASKPPPAIPACSATARLRSTGRRSGDPIGLAPPCSSAIARRDCAAPARCARPRSPRRSRSPALRWPQTAGGLVRRGTWRPVETGRGCHPPRSHRRITPARRRVSHQSPPVSRRRQSHLIPLFRIGSLAQSMERNAPVEASSCTGGPMVRL